MSAQLHLPQSDAANPPSVTNHVGDKPDGLKCGDGSTERRNQFRCQPGQQIDFATSCHCDLKINHNDGMQE